jgi:RNA polymerase sigma-70 factor (ECF subfamily)
MDGHVARPGIARSPRRLDTAGARCHRLTGRRPSARGTFPPRPGLTLREETTVETEALLGRLKAADPGAFEALVVAYQHRVFGIALRMMRDPTEAEDVAQEVFLRVHRGIDAFRGDAKISTWLYAITSRVCLNRLASPSRRSREGEDVIACLPSAEADPAAAAARSELEAALHRAIAELPDDRRIVVVLRDIEGLTYDEIAETLALEPGTVRSRLHRARTELKERLEKLLP